MLILDVKKDESVYIDGGKIVVTVLGGRHGRLKLGVETYPKAMRVDRKEVHFRRMAELEQKRKDVPHDRTL